MTKYELEDFKEWLNKVPEYKDKTPYEKLQHFIDYCRSLKASSQTKINQQQKEIEKLEKSIKELTDKNKLTDQKISDLENQLISLAKQKIKNQKQAKQLLEQLEVN
jgi:septal ring factor EnvC (AmiA/AmiB activator)